MRQIIFKILIITIGSNCFSQGELKFNFNWGEHYKFKKPNLGVSNFVKYDGELYCSYETIEASGVFYPDIKRSREKATFFKLDQDNLRFEKVKSKELNYILFDLDDFRVASNPMGFDDKWIYNPYNHNPRPIIDPDTVALFCAYNDQLYSDTIFPTFRNIPFEAKSRGFLSDINKKKAVYYIDTGVKDEFMNLYFIELLKDRKRLMNSQQIIKYAQLDLDYDSIALISCYQEEGLINGQPFINIGFNLNDDHKFGFVTIVFDLQTNSYELFSKEIDLTQFGFLEDFNGMKIKRTYSENSINFYINLNRTKVTRGENSNTPLDSGTSEDLISFSLDLNNKDYTSEKFYPNAAKNLEYIFEDENEIILIYNTQTTRKEFDEIVDNSRKEHYCFDVVSISNEKSTLYKNCLNAYHSKDIKPTISQVTYLVDNNQNITGGIEIFFFYGPEYYSEEVDYKFCHMTISRN